MKLWIDTDVGSDDAVALIMAFRAPATEVVGLSIVAGNVPAHQAARNALIVAELCGVNVPVYLGAEKPLIRPYIDAKFFHGEDGLGDKGYPMPAQAVQSKHAVDALIDAVKHNPEIVLVTLGPLTNIALAIARAPEIVPLISRCVVMGGAASTYGNITPAAEYNIWVDPDAARMVFLSGMAVEMVGWEFSKGEFALTPAEMAHVRNLDTPYAHFALDCNEVAIKAYHVQTGEHGLALPDPVAMAVALDPSIATMSQHYVEVEIHSDLTRGMTVVDTLNVTDDERNREIWAQARRAGKVSVTWAIDNQRWKNCLYDLLK